MIRMQNDTTYRQDIKRIVEAKPREVSEAICAEEPAELIQALNKAIRYRLGDVTVGSWEHIRESLLEEMADTLISVDILKILYEVSDGELDGELQKKMHRNIQRIYEKEIPEAVRKAFAEAHECCGSCRSGKV
jgi:NTP pyrophosphatase (non-canonical NTP hydrolase)